MVVRAEGGETSASALVVAPAFCDSLKTELVAACSSFEAMGAIVSSIQVANLPDSVATVARMHDALRRVTFSCSRPSEGT